MEVKVKLNNLRVAPRKARHAVDLVRGKKAEEAVSILSFTVNKSAGPLLKLLNSAIDSAKKNYGIAGSKLYISKITADEGPKLKRSHPMSRGRAYPIMKRTSHIVLILSEVKPAVGAMDKDPKSQKPNPKSQIKSKIQKTRIKK